MCNSTSLSRTSYQNHQQQMLNQFWKTTSSKLHPLPLLAFSSSSSSSSSFSFSSSSSFSFPLSFFSSSLSSHDPHWDNNYYSGCKTLYLPYSSAVFILHSLYVVCSLKWNIHIRIWITVLVNFILVYILTIWPHTYKQNEYDFSSLPWY